MSKETNPRARFRTREAAAGALLLLGVVFTTACSTDSHAAPPQTLDAGAGGIEGSSGAGSGSGGRPSGGAAGAASSGEAGAPLPDAGAPNAGGGGLDGGPLDDPDHVPPHGGTVDTNGGVLAGPDGASVTVPEGAVAESVSIDIAEDATDAPSLSPGMLPLGAIYAFTPHGMKFAKPVTVHVPFDVAAVPGGVTPELLQAEPDGAFTQIPAQIEGAVMSAKVSSFSYFVVARVGPISAGYYHTCAMANGGMQCWGDNSFGQLGDGSTTSSATPIYVQGLPQILNAIPGVSPNVTDKISTNYDYSCALLGAGYGVMCWGQSPVVANAAGNSTKPVTVPGLAQAEAISTGVLHACALMPGGTVSCWGDNMYGELGDGSTTYRAAPVEVSGLTSVVAISANGNTSCAVLDDGTARCWGRDDLGQLGDGSLGGTGMQSELPVAVIGIADATSISLGWRHGCTLMKNGTVQCWGNGYGGGTPVAVSGVKDAVAISAGLDYTCALLSDRTVVCWGYGDASPIPIPGLTDVSTISVGFDHQCAMLIDGSARCWGENVHGQLGNGSTRGSATPVVVPLGNVSGSSGSGGSGGGAGSAGTQGSGGVAGGGGTGGSGGTTGSCFDLLYHHGATATDCSVTEEDGSATVAMICSATSCQCYSDNVAYGAAFDVGMPPCDNAIASFQDMSTHCGCP